MIHKDDDGAMQLNRQELAGDTNSEYAALVQKVTAEEGFKITGIDSTAEGFTTYLVRSDSRNAFNDAMTILRHDRVTGANEKTTLSRWDFHFLQEGFLSL